MTFAERLANLGFASYDEYLFSSHWTNFRKRFIGRKCEGCGGRWVNLHHVNYERLGAELDEDVVPLCRDCHEYVHKVCKERRWKISPRSTERALNERRGIPQEARVPRRRKRDKSHRANRCACGNCLSIKRGDTECKACRRKKKRTICGCGNPARYGTNLCRRCAKNIGRAKYRWPAWAEQPPPHKQPYEPHAASLYTVQARKFKRAVGLDGQQTAPGNG